MIDGSDNAIFNSYTTLRNFCVLPGKDSYSNLYPALSSIRDIIKRGSVGSHKVKFIGGGDGAWNSVGLGFGNFFAASNLEVCPYCLVNSDSLHDTTTSFTKRSPEDYLRLTHTPPTSQTGEFIPFTCEGCSTEFTSQGQLDSTQPSTTQEATSFRRQHTGHGYQEIPILPIHNKDWVVCILHLKLRIVERLFMVAVTNKIADKKDAADMVDFLHTLDIRVKKIDNNGKTDHVMSLKKTNLTGHDCDILLRLFDKVLIHLHGGNNEHVADSMVVIHKFIDVYRILSTRAANRAERLMKAVTVRTIGVEFVDHFAAWAGKGKVNFYMHWLVHDIPHQIRSLPCDIFDLSGSGLETKNLSNKKTALQHTNNKTLDAARAAHKSHTNHNLIKTRTVQLQQRDLLTDLTKTGSMARLNKALSKAKARQRKLDRIGSRAVGVAFATAQLNARKHLKKRSK